jgi:two-component system NtrC family sensor kinase
VRIQVLDNGVGIPLENRQRIFAQEFPSGKDGQLNLHNAANWAHELGGQLTVDSDGPGTGACLTLEFPAKPKTGQNGQA